MRKKIVHLGAWSSNACSYWLRGSHSYYKKVRDAVALRIWTKTRDRINSAPIGEHSIFEVAIDETEFDIAVDDHSTVVQGW